MRSKDIFSSYISTGDLGVGCKIHVSRDKEGCTHISRVRTPKYPFIGGYKLNLIGVITHLLTPGRGSENPSFPHLFSAIYRGPISPHLNNCFFWAHLVAKQLLVVTGIHFHGKKYSLHVLQGGPRADRYKGSYGAPINCLINE